MATIKFSPFFNGFSFLQSLSFFTALFYLITCTALRDYRAEQQFEGPECINILKI
jgi:hypothetical protein